MRIITYIDGFNLYHSIKETKQDYLKWQDIKKLSHIFLSKNDDLQAIKFFTAYPQWKPVSCKRHRDYVEILSDMGIEIIMGHFKIKQVFCDKCQTYIPKHEEKQTDVNIALHIARDIYEKKPDAIQIISGDTDLIPPLELAKSKGIKIYVTIPYKRKANGYDSIADKKSKIKVKHLRACFLGASYTTSQQKTFRCPYCIPSIP